MGRNRKQRLVLATVSALALSAAVGTATLNAGVTASATSYPTTLHWVTGAGFKSDDVIGGQLDTNSTKCLGLRKVIMYKETSSGWTQVDKILSSARGAWGFRYEGNDPNPTQVKFTVAKDVRNDGSIVCEAGTQVATFGSTRAPGTAGSSAGLAMSATSYPTVIHWRSAGVDSTDTYVIVMGQLDTNAKCLGLRKVRMYVRTSSGYRRADTILSSATGAWAFRLATPGFTGEQVRWTVTQDTRSHGSVICRGSTAEETF